jgi:glycerol uptake operon antiterminator
MQPHVSLLNLSPMHNLVPAIETLAQFEQALAIDRVRALLLHHCNIFDIANVSHQRLNGRAIYVNIDHIEGVNADSAGIRYLAESLQITGLVSIHSKILAIAKQYGLETIQRIFAVDSTGLEASLASVDAANVDMLDISPALVFPYIIQQLQSCLTLPCSASGLLYTRHQLDMLLSLGIRAIFVSRLALIEGFTE